MGNTRIGLRPSTKEESSNRFGSRGFTLIEVLVTLCFVTVAGLGCLSLAALAVTVGRGQKRGQFRG